MDRDILDLDYYHRPKVCKLCGGVMVFKGVGEYQCENCKAAEYDDYGKVRHFIENHRGATAAAIEEATGVSQRTIRQMLRESRLEVTADSRAFLHCEICNASIRYGRFCSKCETNYHAAVELQQRKEKQLRGFGQATKGEEGAKRFDRNK